MKSFLNFFKQRIDILNNSGRHGTAANYSRAYRSLLKYQKGSDLPFVALNCEYVEKYAAWLQDRGMIRNSLSFHMRILRAVFNRAVREKLCPQINPFNHVYTGIDKTRKRCISQAVVSSLKQLPLEENSALELARDLFLFGLYARGMAFVDIVHLKPNNVKWNLLIYKRRKTGQRLEVAIEPPMRELLKKYVGGDYLFPVLTRSKDEYQDYLRALSKYNYRLRQLSERLGTGISLSSYTPRHTWANLARQMNIPLQVISESLGHTSQVTTEIYLASLDSEVIHEANRKILMMLADL